MSSTGETTKVRQTGLTVPRLWNGLSLGLSPSSLTSRCLKQTGKVSIVPISAEFNPAMPTAKSGSRVQNPAPIREETTKIGWQHMETVPCHAMPWYFSPESPACDVDSVSALSLLRPSTNV